LLADFQVHNVPTHPAPLSALVFLGVLLVLTRLLGVSACLFWLLWVALHSSMLSVIANQRRCGSYQRFRVAADQRCLYRSLEYCNVLFWPTIKAHPWVAYCVQSLFFVLVVYVTLAFYVVTSRVLGGALSITPIVVLLDIFSLCLLAEARSRAYLQLFWMIIPLVTQIGFNTNLLFCSHVLRCRAFNSFQLWYCYLCFVREYYLLFGLYVPSLG
jgi:hypothetical protein